MSDYKQSISRKTTSVLIVLLLSTALSPAYAECMSPVGNTITCSGEVSPISKGGDEAQGPKIVNVIVKDLTSDMTDVGGASEYIRIDESATGKGSRDPGFRAKDSDTGDTQTYGKAASGLTAFNQSVRLNLDDGYGLRSSAGAVTQRGTGADGGTGKKSSGGGSTHRGEYGGDGGAGGRFKFSATGGEVSGQGNPTLDLLTTGGQGGDGGEGYHTAVFHHGYGGGGGQGGRGGAIDVAFKDGAYIASNASGQAGVSVVSKGGEGGHGGLGKSGNKGIGGVGGTGGDGGAIDFTATSKDNAIRASNGVGLYINSAAGRGGNGGRASGSSVEPGDGGDGGKGGDVTVAFSGSVATTGQDSHGLFLQSRGVRRAQLDQRAAAALKSTSPMRGMPVKAAW